ncbi:MAG TPA: DNA-processing protein DprA [Burkholderiaceae bacterium]|nr:DNA-processing protein DprA [Burkholderiaceae bacterium]
MSAPDDLDAWLRLLRTPGVGRATARKLLASFGSAASVLAAKPAALRALVGEAQADALARLPDDHDALMQATRAWLAAGPARGIVVLGDAAYPPALLESPDPPLLLYAIGRIEALALPSIAIVGSRNPSAQGRDNARAFAEHLGRAGLAVVSGLALGIDGAAHEGALAAGAVTVAVMGTGADRIYPARHRALAHRIVDGGGLLVTEFDVGMPPLPEHFPQRNRIIAGLARGTLVVEAALPSGSLSTARAAADAGREVFAIPGSIHAPQSRGCHALIKQGAKLVESAADVLEELSWRPSPPAAVGSAPEPAADALLDALGHDPVTLDALAARTGESAATLGARLLELELDGHVARLPGGLFQRRAAV